MTDKNTGVELLNTEEVKALFEGVGAPAEKLDEFVEVFNAAVTAQTNARVEVLVAEKVAESNESRHLPLVGGRGHFT